MKNILPATIPAAVNKAAVPVMERSRLDARSLAAFAALVVITAGNAVAVRYVTNQMPSFWGAATRFASASLIFFAYVLIKRLQLPRGRALVGTLIFGGLQFGFSYGMGYWALQKIPAGLGSVMFAAIPLFTILFAVAVRLERFQWKSILGSFIALGGVLILSDEQINHQVPLANLLAMLGMVMCFAMATIVVKKFPPVPIAVMNAVAMMTGAAILFGLSLAFGEKPALPGDAATWLAQLSLILPGSVLLFVVLLYLLKRWPASAVSFQVVVSPIIAVALSAWLLGEPPTPGLLLGGPLVLLGVYLGAISRK